MGQESGHGLDSSPAPSPTNYNQDVGRAAFHLEAWQGKTLFPSSLRLLAEFVSLWWLAFFWVLAGGHPRVLEVGGPQFWALLASSMWLLTSLSQPGASAYICYNGAMWHNEITTGVAFHHLHCILFVESKSQVVQTLLKGIAWDTDARKRGLTRSHLRVCPPHGPTTGLQEQEQRSSNNPSRTHSLMEKLQIYEDQPSVH